MKTAKRALALLLLLSTLLTLAACGQKEAVAETFREAGYTVTPLDPGSKEGQATLERLGLSAEAASYRGAEVYLCEKSRIPLALYLVFPTSGRLRRFFAEKADYKKAREEGRIRGDCYLRYAAGDALLVYRGE